MAHATFPRLYNRRAVRGGNEPWKYKSRYNERLLKNRAFATRQATLPSLGASASALIQYLRGSKVTSGHERRVTGFHDILRRFMHFLFCSNFELYMIVVCDSDQWPHIYTSLHDYIHPTQQPPPPPPPPSPMACNPHLFFGLNMA